MFTGKQMERFANGRVPLMFTGKHGIGSQWAWVAGTGTRVPNIGGKQNMGGKQVQNLVSYWKQTSWFAARFSCLPTTAPAHT